MSKITAVKIGGSFFNDKAVKKIKNITSIIEQISSGKSQEKFLLITGGGRAADLVREFDSAADLDDKSAHFAAIAAMELNAYLLSDFFEDFSFCSADTFLGENNQLNDNNINIFLPLEYYRRLDPLPHSWQVSSDSIALELAYRVGAASLILMKQRGYRSVDKGDAFNKDSGTANNTSQHLFLSNRVSAGKISDDGLIDNYFPQLLQLLKDVSKYSSERLDCIAADANHLSEFEKYLNFKDEERGRLSLRNLIKII